MSKEEEHPLFDRSNELPSWGSIGDVKTTKATKHSYRRGLSKNASDKLSKYRNGFQISVGTKDFQHNDYVNAVCATGDGRFIASASDDRTILVWKMNNGKFEIALKLTGHDDVIVSLFALPNNYEILSASYDGTIKRWGLLTGVITLDIKDEDKTSHCLAVYYVQDDGRGYIIQGARSRDKNEVGVFKIYDDYGHFLIRLKDHANYVRCFAATSEASSQRYLFSGSLDKTITRWDLRTYFQERILTRMPWQEVVDGTIATVKLRGHTDWVRSICVTKDDLRLVSCSNDKTIRIWDVHSTECIQTLRGHTEGVRSVCISEDGSQIISGSEDMTVRLWDLQTGSPIRILRGHYNWITCVSTLPGTDLILSASSDKTVKLWDVYTTPMLRSFDHERSNPVLCVCGAQESTIFTCTKDTLYVWDENQHEGSAPKPKAKVCNEPKAGSETEKIEIACMCMINEDTVVTGSNISEESEHKSSIVEVWHFNNDIIEQNPERWYFDRRRSFLTCLFHCNPVICGFKNKTITIIYLDKDYDCNGTVPLSISCIQYDEYYLIMAGCENKEIYIWKYSVQGKHASADRDMTHIWTLRGHIYPVRCLTYTTDRKYIVSGSDDYTIKMWSIPSNESSVTSIQIIKPHHSFKGHTRSISSVRCTKDYLISSSADKMIMVWCLKHLCLLRTLIGHTDEIKMIHVTQTSRLFSASKDGTMRIWDLSVGRNVPFDQEQRKLIRVRHNEYGFSPQVTNVIDLIVSASKEEKIFIPLDIVKSSLQNAATVALSSHKTEKEIEEAIEDTMKHLMRPRTTDVVSSPYELGGMMKTFELTVREGAESTELLPLGDEDGVQVPLVHWMSRNKEYREFLLTKILPNHPELLYSCDNSITSEGGTTAQNDNAAYDGIPGLEQKCTSLLRRAVESSDPNFIFRILDVLSSFLKANPQEMMSHAHYSVIANEENSCLLLDIEDVAFALEEFWEVNAKLKTGILELQRAPPSIQDGFDKSKMNFIFWDGDGEDDRMKVDGSINIFDRRNWNNTYVRKLFITEYIHESWNLLFQHFSKPRRSELMEALYVPFPMRICQRKQYSSQHSSSLLLEVCVEGALKSSDNTSIFKSNVLSAILAFKLRMFGWTFLYFKIFFCFTLLAHFGLHSMSHVKTERNVFWFFTRFLHFLPVVVLELVPYFLSSDFRSKKYSSTLSWTGVTVLVALAMLGIFCVLWICNENPGSELDNILSAISFFMLFTCAMNNLKYFPSIGKFVRMLLQVLERMRYYVLLLVMYLFGFAITFHILMFSVIGYFDKECSDGNGTGECGNVQEATERFRLTSLSWVTMFSTMMGVSDWDATAFGVPRSYSAIALIFLFLLFVFVSNVFLNITISVMSEIYGEITKNEHASYHVELARYVLGIERLLLFFCHIKLEDEKYFPRWIVVLSPQKINVDDKNTDGLRTQN